MHEETSIPDFDETAALIHSTIERVGGHCIDGEGYQLCRHLAHEIRSALAEPPGDTVQAPESPTDSTPKAGRGGSSEAETATGPGQARDIDGVSPSSGEPYGPGTVVDVIAEEINETVGMKVSWPRISGIAHRAAARLRREGLLALPGDTGQAPEPGYERIPQAIEGACEVAAMDVEIMQDGHVVGWIQTTEIRALLGTDTTPDRLAWISKAGETAAVERQARYQETACARRPAEETP